MRYKQLPTGQDLRAVLAHAKGAWPRLLQDFDETSVRRVINICILMQEAKTDVELGMANAMEEILLNPAEKMLAQLLEIAPALHELNTIMASKGSKQLDVEAIDDKLVTAMDDKMTLVSQMVDQFERIKPQLGRLGLE